MNIRVDLTTPINDGTEVVFRSPVDCSQITGLIVYYQESGNTLSKEFALADAHGNNVGDIDHLFAENVVVKVILDVTAGMAFVQNADTNAYLEWRFKDTIDKLAPSFTESGSAVTCEPIEGYPLEVVSYINPIQEGSGEPSPGGVNLIAGVAYKTAGNWKTNTLDGKDAYVCSLGDDFTDGQYCFSGNSGYNVYLVRFNEYSGEYETLAGGQGTFREVCEATFYEDWDHKRLSLGFFQEDVDVLQDALDVLESLKLEHGSGGNIRPIRGQTSVNLSHGGTNLFDDVAFYKANGFEKQADGTWFGYNMTKVIYENTNGNNEQITISATGKRTDPNKNTFCFRVKYTDGTSQYLTPFSTDTAITTTILRTDASKIVSTIEWSHGVAGTFYVKDVQLEYGAIASGYNAYRESVSISVELGQTVYGGTYNFATGELTINKTLITLDSSIGWYEAMVNDSKSCSVFVGQIGTSKAIGFNTSICSHFHNTCDNSPYNAAKVKVGTYTDHITLTNIYVDWGTDDATTGDFKAWLDEQKVAGTPVQLLYNLAEPITIQLTPHEIIGFKGTNALSVDVDNISVTGKADPVAIIDKLTKAILSLGGNV